MRSCFCRHLLKKGIKIKKKWSYYLPRSWGGISSPPFTSEVTFGTEETPLWCLICWRWGTDPFEALFRNAFSAIAAATLDEWSLSLVWLFKKEGDENRSEASGSWTDADEISEVIPDCTRVEDTGLLQNCEGKERKKKMRVGMNHILFQAIRKRTISTYKKDFDILTYSSMVTSELK